MGLRIDLFINLLLSLDKLMIICVSAAAASLDAEVDPRFGRCAYFVLVDSETMRFETLPNVDAGAMHGAGVQAAQTVANKGVGVVITGNVGPNAFQVLSAAGIKIITGANGTVRQVIEKHKGGKLNPSTDLPNVSAHFGMGGGGMGYGRGAGRVYGRSFRHGQTFPIQSPSSPESQPIEPNYQRPPEYQATTSTHYPTPKDELAALENCRKRLSEELEGLQARIEELRHVAQEQSD